MTTEQQPTYTAADRDQILEAAGHIASVIHDIAHHELGDTWDLYDDTPTEIARLRYRLDQLDAATSGARAELAVIELAARLRTVWTQTLAAYDIPLPGSAEDAEEEITAVARTLSEAAPADAAAAVVVALSDNGWDTELAYRMTTTREGGVHTIYMDETRDQALATARRALTAVAAKLYPKEES